MDVTEVVHISAEEEKALLLAQRQLARCERDAAQIAAHVLSVGRQLENKYGGRFDFDALVINRPKVETPEETPADKPDVKAGRKKQEAV